MELEWGEATYSGAGGERKQLSGLGVEGKKPKGI